jgi:RNA polymerase sigma factor (sigma-70 family)
MQQAQLGTVLRFCRGLTVPEATRDLTDQDLLHRFTSSRDETAFVAIVQRHARLVWSVCRNVLQHEQDAEDCVQACFLVLANRAETIKKADSLANWLHGVAYRTALLAKRKLAARRAHERSRQAMRQTTSTTEAAWKELLAVLDAEIRRLPEKYGAPFVLCCLEGLSGPDAARQLGWKEGTVSGRLCQARKLLRERLARRGIQLALVMGGLALAQREAQGAGMMRLAEAARGGVQTAGVTERAASLAQGVMKAMSLARLKPGLALALLLTTLLAGGLAALQPQAPAKEPETPTAQAEGPAKTDQSPKDLPTTDRFGDPLPPGAVARMGSLRFYHGTNVTDVVLSPDGKLVVAGVRGGYRLWDAATGKELPLDNKMRAATHFAADGKLLAVLKHNDGLQLSDISTGKEVASFALASQPDLFAVAPDGKTLVVWTQEPNRGHTVRFCDVATAKVGEPLPLAAQIAAFAFAADSKTLVMKSTDDAVLVWDLAGRSQRLATPANAADFGGPLALSPDGKVLATGPKEIRLWDTATLKELPALEGQPGARVASLAFSGDGQLLSACGGGPKVRLWDLITRKSVRALQGKDAWVNSTVFSADGKTLAGADGDGVTLWDVDTGRYRHEFGQTYQIWSPAFSPDGTTLITGGGYTDLVIRRWETSSGRETGQWRGHTSGVQRLAFSPNGKLVASGSQDRTARIWDFASGKELHRLEAKDGMVYALAFSPDGKTLATGGNRQAVHLWDVGTGKEIRAFANPTKQLILRLGFSADGTTLASLADDEAGVRLWDVETGKEIRRLGGEASKKMSAFDFSPAGQTLATSGYDGTVRLWECATGRQIRVLAVAAEGNQDPPWAYAVAFAPDGRSVAAAYADQSVRVWEVVSGRQRERFEGHRNAVLGVAYSADGTLLASGSADRTAVVWDVTGQRTSSAQGKAATAKELEAHWAELAEPDARTSYLAIKDLLAAGPRTVALFRERLHPATRVDEKKVAVWIAQLESQSFKEREQANRELEKVGEGAEAALRKALEGKASLEMSRRVEKLLARLDTSSPERLRTMRAMEILEYIGTAEALQLLQHHAEGSEGSWTTHEAKSTLERLKKMASPQG